jgi:hypothetical protein
VLVAAAVCPHPPLLIPEIGRGLGAPVEALRAGSIAAVGDLLAAGIDRIYVVGSGAGPSATSFAPWAPGSGAESVAVDVPEPLPLAVLVGAWLTRGRQRSFVVVDPTTDAEDSAALGRELADTDERVALLVMGDGSARHDVKAPGYVDPRAASWDETAHAAFLAGDFAALLALDPLLGEELMCAGRAPWQVLAGAAETVAFTRKSAQFDVIFGVGYHLVTWV